MGFIYSYFLPNKEIIIQTKAANLFEIIKNKYILQQILDYLEKKKSLELIKKNKKIKNRLNININDYKEYSGKYSSIEVEIRPAIGYYGKFINIKDEERIYYHIYFDNNKEEIKRKHIEKNEKIELIKIIIDHQIKSFKGLFEDCVCIQSINFKKFFRNDITNMEAMFARCGLLKELNLNNFNTNNVTNMRAIFAGCSSLRELNLKNFYTNNVTNMNSMFDHCSLIKELNLNNFITNNVTNMSYMFSGCSSLEKLNLNNFNTNNVTDMGGMFHWCSSLKELNIDNFNTNKVKDMYGMFYYCKSLKELNLDNFNTNNVTNMVGMFWECSKELRMKIKARYKNINEKDLIKYVNNILFFFCLLK